MMVITLTAAGQGSHGVGLGADVPGRLLCPATHIGLDPRDVMGTEGGLDLLCEGHGTARALDTTGRGLLYSARVLGLLGLLQLEDRLVAASPTSPVASKSPVEGSGTGLVSYSM